MYLPQRAMNTKAYITRYTSQDQPGKSGLVQFLGSYHPGQTLANLGSFL